MFAPLRCTSEDVVQCLAPPFPHASRLLPPFSASIPPRLLFDPPPASPSTHPPTFWPPLWCFAYQPCLVPSSTCGSPRASWGSPTAEGGTWRDPVGVPLPSSAGFSTRCFPGCFKSFPGVRHPGTGAGRTNERGIGGTGEWCFPGCPSGVCRATFTPSTSGNRGNRGKGFARSHPRPRGISEPNSRSEYSESILIEPTDRQRMRRPYDAKGMA
eukprot:scaffold640_cov362-Pavlova_lutheri.AAC.6